MMRSWIERIVSEKLGEGVYGRISELEHRIGMLERHLGLIYQKQANYWEYPRYIKEPKNED